MNAAPSLASVKGANVLTLSAVTFANVPLDTPQPQMAPAALVSKELQTWVWIWASMLESRSLNPRKRRRNSQKYDVNIFQGIEGFP